MVDSKHYKTKRGSSVKSEFRKKNKKQPSSRYNKWFIGLFISLFITFIAYIIFPKHSVHDNPLSTVNAFGISMPDGYDVHGIDMSYFQGNIAWNKLKNAEDHDIKIQFVYIKATEGVTRQDKMFNRNWQNAKNAGVIRGAYHYFITSRDGKAQAANFIKTVHLQKGDLPPVLDIEVLKSVSPEKMREELHEWLDMVEDTYNIRPIIYTHVHFYETYLNKEFDDYPLWIAHYRKHTIPKINRSWILWQHDEEGRIPGIKGHFDFNVFNGSQEDFENLQKE